MLHTYIQPLIVTLQTIQAVNGYIMSKLQSNTYIYVLEHHTLF